MGGPIMRVRDCQNARRQEVHFSVRLSLSTSACQLQPRQQPSSRRWVPRATTRRQDATLVQLSRNSPHAGEPLGPQVIHEPWEIGVTDEHLSHPRSRCAARRNSPLIQLRRQRATADPAAP
jgi:hypothetical protein